MQLFCRFFSEVQKWNARISHLCFSYPSAATRESRNKSEEVSPSEDWAKEVRIWRKAPCSGERRSGPEIPHVPWAYSTEVLETKAIGQSAKVTCGLGVPWLWPNKPRNELKGGKMCVGLWFWSMVICLHCFWTMVRQNTMAGQSCSPHGDQEAKGEEGSRSPVFPSKHIPSTLRPPSRPHFLTHHLNSTTAEDQSLIIYEPLQNIPDPNYTTTQHLSTPEVSKMAS